MSVKCEYCQNYFKEAGNGIRAHISRKHHDKFVKKESQNKKRHYTKDKQGGWDCGYCKQGELKLQDMISHLLTNHDIDISTK